MDTLVHGKASTYTNHACRCDACRAASNAKVKAWREKNRRRDYSLKQDRSMARDILAQRHHGEYLEILAAIRAGEVLDP